ncbi:MAG: hypothetical protein K2M16_09325 [Muribaculaceae bacterium]|nr:hypothetical protein [Muribaculaceae bacterium]
MKKIFTAFGLIAGAFATLQATPPVNAPQVRMNAAAVDDNVVFDTPDGELKWLNRSCDGFVTQAFDATHGEILGSIVQMVEGEDGYVYLSHMASEYPVNTWTRFEREGNTLVMNGVQAIYKEHDYDYDEDFIVYLAPMEVVVNEYNVGTFVVPEDCRYVLNIGEDGSLTSADPKMLLGVCVHTPDASVEGNDVWIWKGFGDRDIKMVPATGEPVSLPEGIEVSDWVMTDDYVNVFVQVAIDGDDFYVCGMDRSLPDSWVKGKISDGKVVFPSGQYLGADMDIFYYSYFCGADFFDSTDDEGNAYRACQMADTSVFAYDAEKGRITAESGYIINSTPTELFPLYFYENVVIGKQHRNPDTAPEAPYGLDYFESDWGNHVWFMLPNVDVEGNILHVENLYYEIYVNDELQYFDIVDEDWNVENTSRVPYLYDDWEDFWVDSTDPSDHSVYLYYDGVVNSIAIRSIYVNENGEDVYSKMGYWNDPSSVAGVAVNEPVSVKWYDLQGREVNGGSKGIAVKVATYADGTTTHEKVMVK